MSVIVINSSTTLGVSTSLHAIYVVKSKSCQNERITINYIINQLTFGNQLVQSKYFHFGKFLQVLRPFSFLWLRLLKEPCYCVFGKDFPKIKVTSRFDSGQGPQLSSDRKIVFTPWT